MRGLLNIVLAVIMCMCLHACKTRMHTYERVEEAKFDSIGSVTRVNTSTNLDMWCASRIIENAKSGSWQKILIFDTSKPGNPLLMDIERKDTMIASTEEFIGDSLSIVIEVSKQDSSNHVSESDIENDIEAISEDRASDMILNIANIGFLILIIYGFFVLYKKIH